MNKLRSYILLLLLLSLPILYSNVSSAEPVKVIVNGNQLLLPADPILRNGRTLVPLRAVSESMGATVEWDQATKTVNTRLGTKTIILQINNTIALVDDKEVHLDVPMTIVDGITLVPVRFIAEGLGVKVDWDNNTKTIIINTNIPTYKVIRVVDGDTFKVDFNGVEKSVRLIGVDTPESVHPDSNKNTDEGNIASDYTKKLIEGKNIVLEFDVQEKDQYGRLLAYAYIDGDMVNKLLLQEGYAKVSTYPPNIKYVDEFTTIEKKARENKKGFWSDEEYLSLSEIFKPYVDKLFIKIQQILIALDELLSPKMLKTYRL